MIDSANKDTPGIQKAFSHARLIFFSFFVIFFLANDSCTGLAAGDKYMDSQKVLILKEKDNGSEIKVRSGEVIQIELEGTGSAGYWWYFDKLDSVHLALLSEETKNISPHELIGAPVLGIWRLKTLKAGYSDIKMNYYRKWEGEEKAEKHFRLKLNISN